MSPPDEFQGYEKVAYTKGFLMVSASPLTRSSHHAGDDFAKLRAARAARCPLEPSQCRNSPASAGSATARTQMFDLVADVERYPEFVPLCQSLKIRQRTPRATAPRSSSPT